MNWREVAVLYRNEVRSALRQRTIVVNSILVPIFLYPLMLWLIMTGMTFVAGWSERIDIEVAVAGLPELHGKLRRWLERNERLELSEREATESAEAELGEAVRRGEIDAALLFLPPAAESDALPGNFRVRLLYDGSRDRGDEARSRLEEMLRDYRAEWLRERAATWGVGDADWAQFEIGRRNLATGEEMGAMVLGLLLPFFLVIMVAVGCFHPAIDATAGERERGTWETLMTVAASRRSIVAAKYLYVSSFGVLAGLLNLTAMVLSSSAVFAPLLEAGDALRFEFPLRAIPVAAVGAVLLALFAAAGMMVLAVFARTFKEGQSMITPFYLLLFMPAIFLQQPDLELTPVLASIPIANVLMVVREAIAGRFDPGLIGLTFAVEVVAVLLCLWLASRVVRSEEVMVGTYEGSLMRFLRERRRRGRSGTRVAKGDG